MRNFIDNFMHVSEYLHAKISFVSARICELFNCAKVKGAKIRRAQNLMGLR